MACQAKPPLRPAAGGSLCIGRYVGFGQNTSSLWCRQDSCFAVRHARNQVAAALVGYYAGAIAPEGYVRARGLASKVVAKKDWKMMAGSPSIRIVLDDTLQRTVSSHPDNTDPLEALEDWKDAMLDTLESHPLWTDSLALQANKGRDSAALRLTSGKSREAWLGNSPDIKVLFGSKDAQADSQVTVAAACAKNLFSGGRCLVALPKGTRWVKAIVRGSPQDGTLGAGKTCLEGRFELASEWVAISESH
ncbi:MAG: hypothetical protein JWO30_4422 [Fibrobacteres bacterium]|nr:hypothetical protein [Fibrobacterota bacterium]